MRKSHILASMAFALLGAAASSALATPVVTTANGDGGTFSVSSTDLINQGQSTYSSFSYGGTSSGFGDPINSPTSSLNDGVVYPVNSGDTTGSFCPDPGATATFNLDTSTNTLGYDITSIVSLTGYESGGVLTGQAYTVAYSTVSDPTNFITLATVSEGDDNNEVQETIADSVAGNALATHVADLQFTFGADPGGYFTDVYREIDVFGAPTTVPEPASLSLLSLGGLALLRRRRRQLA